MLPCDQAISSFPDQRRDHHQNHQSDSQGDRAAPAPALPLFSLYAQGTHDYPARTVRGGTLSVRVSAAERGNQLRVQTGRFTISLYMRRPMACAPNLSDCVQSTVSAI
jgi:hypothetical protein